MSRCRALVVLAACALAAGCSPHYALTEPGSERIYLARSYDREDGAVRFKDRVARERVTLSSPEITEIGGDEYDALLGRLRERTTRGGG